MIQVFLGHHCPTCGQFTTESRSILQALINLPYYIENYDYSIYFDIDIIKDNAEAALVVELCTKYRLDYHVFDEGDEEYLYIQEEWAEEYFQTPEQATADLEFLNEVLSRYGDMRTPRAAGHHSVCV